MQLLKSIDKQYLEDFLLHFNNKIRYHSFQPEELILFCAKKFNINQVKEISKFYRLNLTPSEAARKMKDLNGLALGRRFIMENKPAHYAFEVGVGSNICDIVFLDNKDNIVAVEIKANGDSLERAEKQCEAYSVWADYVYVLTEFEKLKAVNKLISRKFGRYLYKKDIDKFVKFKSHKFNHKDYSVILNNLNNQKLRYISQKYNIKPTSNKGKIFAELQKLNNKEVKRDIKLCLLK